MLDGPGEMVCAAPRNGPSYLYRLFDADDILLWIGVTQFPELRMLQHEKDKPWWPEVARTEMRLLPSRVEALAQESRALVMENPCYNIAGISGRERDRRALAFSLREPRPGPMWMTIRAVAKRWPVSAEQIRVWVSAGDLPCIQVRKGTQRYVRSADADAFAANDFKRVERPSGEGRP